MKILIITPTYIPAYKFGGTVAAMSQFATALNTNNDVDVTIYTTNASGEEDKINVKTRTPITIEGVKVFYFDCDGWNNSAFYSIDMIKYLKNNIQIFDIVYISAIWQWIGYKSAKVCIKNNIPYIIGTHGSFSDRLRKKSKLKKEIYRYFFLSHIFNKANAIHVTGEQEIKDSGGWLYNYPTIKIPNIINSEKYYIDTVSKHSFRKRHSIPSGSKIILFVCRPDWMKRVDILIEAIKNDINYYLLYIGDENNIIVDAWKNKAKKHNMENRFICTGILRDKKLIEAYNNADIFSLISMNENFGMVVVEAMLCGVPVLISKEVGLCEYLSNNEYSKITSLDPKDIKNDLYEMLRNNFKKEDIRRSALNLFSEKELSTNFIKEFREIINARGEK